MCRHEPVVPVRASPGRLLPEPVPAEPAQACSGRCLSLPVPLKDRKKRCIQNDFGKQIQETNIPKNYRRFFEEKILIENLEKYFLLKIF